MGAEGAERSCWTCNNVKGIIIICRCVRTGFGFGGGSSEESSWIISQVGVLALDHFRHERLAEISKFQKKKKNLIQKINNARSIAPKLDTYSLRYYQ